MNGLPEGATRGDAYGFVGPLVPPSADLRKRDAQWDMSLAQATWYMWGLSDAGQRRDANDIYRFGTLYADAYWEFRCNYRGGMKSMLSAVEAFDAGERI